MIPGLPIEINDLILSMACKPLVTHHKRRFMPCVMDMADARRLQKLRLNMSEYLTTTERGKAFARVYHKKYSEWPFLKYLKMSERQYDRVMDRTLYCIENSIIQTNYHHPGYFSPPYPEVMPSPYCAEYPDSDEDY